MAKSFYKIFLFGSFNVLVIYLIYTNVDFGTSQTKLNFSINDEREKEENWIRTSFKNGSVFSNVQPSGDTNHSAKPILSKTISKEKPSSGEEKGSTAQQTSGIVGIAGLAGEVGIEKKTEASLANGSLLLPSTNGQTKIFTRDIRLEAALKDSSEIELWGNPVLSSTGGNIANMTYFLREMAERVQLKTDYCTQIKQHHRQNPGLPGLPVVNYAPLYALPKYDFVWCPVYKAASTNWMHNLLYLAGKNDEEVNEIKERFPGQPNEQGRVVAPFLNRNGVDVLVNSPNSKRMIIVRHPFDRLVSAFRDKLERCHGPQNCTFPTAWYYKMYGKNIVEKYRKKAEQKFSKEFFSERNNYGAPVPVEKTWRSPKMPSWWEFVQYVIDSSPNQFDEHWKPMSLYCSMCSFNYNYILHFENIQQEESYFSEIMGAKGLIKNRWENKNGRGYSREEIVGKYFQLLDEDDILKLYQIYKDDFQMFGYTFEFRGLRLNLGP